MKTVYHRPYAYSQPQPLTELFNQLLSAPTLTSFEEKVLASLLKEQEQK